jgi:hypothetical protein
MKELYRTFAKMRNVLAVLVLSALAALCAGLCPEFDVGAYQTPRCRQFNGWFKFQMSFLVHVFRKCFFCLVCLLVGLCVTYSDHRLCINAALNTFENGVGNVKSRVQEDDGGIRSEFSDSELNCQIRVCLRTLGCKQIGWGGKGFEIASQAHTKSSFSNALSLHKSVYMCYIMARTHRLEMAGVSSTSTCALTQCA